jgi:hypothetical protein
MKFVFFQEIMFLVENVRYSSKRNIWSVICMLYLTNNWCLCIDLWNISIN